MSSIKATGLFTALTLVSSISHVGAHGFISGIVIGGEHYQGFNPGAYPYQLDDPPKVIGWTYDAPDTGFVSPNQYGGGDIACGKNGSPGAIHASVAAGSSIDLQWNQWPESHHGPVIDYMAKCDGECEKADKTALKFFKIAEAGLVNGSPAPGFWESDNLIANNNTWSVTVPASVAPGNYVLRHEIIALHSADKPDGAQNYPQCINLEVTGSGTETPAGIPATEFYTSKDPGIFLSIYYPALESYTIPGPPLFSGGSAGGSGAPPASSGSMPKSSSMVDGSASSPAPEAPTYAAEVPTSAAEALTYAAEVPTSATDGPTPSAEASTSAAETTTSAAEAPTDGTEAPTSVVEPMEPSMTPTTMEAVTTMTIDEETTTITTSSTITMTTTVKKGCKPTAANSTSSEAPSAPTPTVESPSNATSTSNSPSTPIADSSSESEPTSPTPTSSPPSSEPTPDSYSYKPEPGTFAESTPSPTGSTNATASASASAIPSIISAVASAIESAAAPTSSAEASEPENPAAGLPGNMNLQEFIEWLTQLISQYFGKQGNGGENGNGNGRKHARDLGM